MRGTSHSLSGEGANLDAHVHGHCHIVDPEILMGLNFCVAFLSVKVQRGLNVADYQ